MHLNRFCGVLECHYADGKNQDGVGAINAEKYVCLGKF